MARERLWLGGLDVATKAIKAVDLSGCLNVPEKRGENLTVDGRNGAIRVGRKKYNGRQAPFEFQVHGLLPDGTVPADPQTQLYVNLRSLGQVLSQDLLPMVHQLPDGSMREIPVEVAVALEPERARTGDFLTVGIAFDSASAFWRGQDDTTAAFSLADDGEYELAEFTSSEAPIDDSVVTIGASNNPLVTDVVSGTFLAYDDVIGAGQALTVDCGTGRITATGGLVPDRTKLRTHPEDGRWLALSPAIGGPPTVRLNETGGNTVPLTVTGRQSWVFG